jgi:hypothetical protein
MSLFLVELWIDGYDSKEKMEEACIEFIEQQLNFSASSVNVSLLTNKQLAALERVEE